jgi:hypothetical protein
MILSADDDQQHASGFVKEDREMALSLSQYSRFDESSAKVFPGPRPLPLNIRPQPPSSDGSQIAGFRKARRD